MPFVWGLVEENQKRIKENNSQTEQCRKTEEKKKVMVEYCNKTKSCHHRNQN